MNLLKLQLIIFTTYLETLMKNKFTILGCGSSLGSPWITNYKGKLKNIKNIRTRCCAHIQKRKFISINRHFT